MKYTINGEYVERWRYLEHLIENSTLTEEDYKEWLEVNDIKQGDKDYRTYEDWVGDECEAQLRYDEEHALGSVGD